MRFLSLPVRGAWVEILQGKTQLQVAEGRSPCGERGLKFGLQLAASQAAQSLPVRGAWVEILPIAEMSAIAAVAPRAGSVG